MVGDGHTVSVAAEIVQHIFGATEGRFQVDHPVLSKQRPQPGGKDPGVSEEFQISLEAELATLKSLLERIDKLAAKGVRLSMGAPGLLRAITHMDVTLAQCEEAAQAVVEVLG